MKISKFISGPMQINEALLVIYLIGKNENTYKNWERSKRFMKLEDGSINISDWLVQGMMGMNMLVPRVGRRHKLELTEHALMIYEEVLRSSELIDYFEGLKKKLTQNPKQSLRWPKKDFFKLLEDTGVMDTMLNAIHDSIVCHQIINFFKEKKRVKKAHFRESFWEYVNEKDVIAKSKTATASDNRLGPVENIFKTLGIIGEYNDEYIILDQGEHTEIEILDAQEEAKIFEDKRVQAMITRRAGQSYLRGKLISRDKKCIVCSIDHPDLLAAGHVKRHSLSGKNEKYDLDNGILLCKLHDKLFEECMITFDKEGALVFGKYVEENKNTLLLDSYVMSKKINYKNRYFDIHRKNFEEKNKNAKQK